MYSGLHKEDVEHNPVIAGLLLSMSWGHAITCLPEGHTGLIKDFRPWQPTAAKDSVYLWLTTAC